MWKDENPRTRTSERRPMSEEQTSKSTDSKSSGKYKKLITRRLQYPRISRILTCPWDSRGPVLKTIGHKLRKKRKICRQARNERLQIKHP